MIILCKLVGTFWYVYCHIKGYLNAGSRRVCVCKVIMANEYVYAIYLLIPTIGIEVAFPTTYPTSCLLGYVDMVDCLSQEDYTEQVSPSGLSSHNYRDIPS